MAKKRIYEVAKEVGVDNKVVVQKAKDLGFDVKNHMSSIDDEDFSEEDDSYEITTTPEDFGAVSGALEEAGVAMASAEVTMIPQTWASLTSEEDIKKMNRILSLLDDEDDVQNVYHNWEESEE